MRYRGSSPEPPAKESPEQSRKAVRNCKEEEIESVIGSFIVGAPIGTETELRRTSDFALSLDGMDFPQTNPLCISTGMDLWEIAVKGIPERAGAVGGRAAHGMFMHPSFFCQLLKTLKSKYRLRIFMANFRAGTRSRRAPKQLAATQNLALLK